MARGAALGFLFVLFGISATLSAEPRPPAPRTPFIAGSSEEGERAVAGFQLSAGLQANLFASEPQVANPVAIDVDHRGRVFVCETFRIKNAVVDNRERMVWLDDDLAAQTVEDRRAIYAKYLPDSVEGFTRQDDRIRLLIDRNRDGRADHSSVFASGFNDVVEGIGAGVLAHGKDVYYTCIPKLWKLHDRDGDGTADQREALHDGYGVRVAFRGHDLHGLTIGPDGKLYFSIGDRGYNVKTPDAELKDPESGAVFRCNLDGSKLEVIATGLRNPQELAFNELGDLFTGENNSDSGDEARWVHLVEGADLGWRMAYQYLDDRGPWNREKMWQTHHTAQPAFIVPPVANLATGPSGVAFYPGTGLSDHFRGRFLLCDFRGSAHNSGVLSFRVKQKGATYEISDLEKTIWNLLATDVDFGPDGSIYVSDWVEGWDGTGKGRIYRFVDPKTAEDPTRREVQRILSKGMETRSYEQLMQLLSHADRRVRLATQFAMVDRNLQAVLQDIASSDGDRLPRIHAIWGLQHFPSEIGTQLTLRGLMSDQDAEIRAQAAKVTGSLGSRHDAELLTKLLEDESPRVRHFAAIAIGKLGSAAAIPRLLKMLAANDDRDPVLRHAAVMGLAGVSRPEDLVKVVVHPSAAARMGALLALRRLKSPLIAGFLDDSSERLVVEAARGIHDVPIDAAYPQLAALILRPLKSDALLRRVLNANYRLGGAEHASALAVFAGQSTAPTAMRLEALEMLANWQQPSSRDRVSGIWRPIHARDPQSAVTAIKKSLPTILAGPHPIRMRAAMIAGTVGIDGAGDALLEMFQDQSSEVNVRADSLKMLSLLQHKGLPSAIDAAVQHEDVLLRMAALHALARHDCDRAIPLLEKKIYDGEIRERQVAINVLSTINDPRATRILSAGVDTLIAGAMPVEIRLELLQAIDRRDVVELTKKVEVYQAAKPKDDPLSPYSEALAGGDVKRGKQIFFHHTAAACLRCHRVDGRGGDVGPDLSQIGQQLTREQLLESIVSPSRSIAKGFQTVQVVTKQGRILVGLVRDNDNRRVRLVAANDQITEILKAEIDEIVMTTKSAMPDDVVQHLSLRELRDLVEYLSSLRPDGDRRE